MSDVDIGQHSRVITFPIGYSLYQYQDYDKSTGIYQYESNQIAKSNKQVSRGYAPNSNSIIDNVIVANNESASVYHFIYSTCLAVYNSILGDIYHGILIALSIVSIIIGSVYTYDCNVEPKIPVWLIVIGIFTLLSATFALSVNIQEKRRLLHKNHHYAIQPYCYYSKYAIDIFLFAWFIAGNVWIYGNYYNVQYDSLFPNYCQITCYLFAFSIVTITWISVGVLLFFLLIIFPCIYFTHKYNNANK